MEAYVIINILDVSNCHLMVFLTLKLIVFSNKAFFIFAVFLFFFV